MYNMYLHSVYIYICFISVSLCRDIPAMTGLVMIRNHGVEKFQPKSVLVSVFSGGLWSHGKSHLFHCGCSFHKSHDVKSTSPPCLLHILPIRFQFPVLTRPCCPFLHRFSRCVQESETQRVTREKKEQEEREKKIDKEYKAAWDSLKMPKAWMGYDSFHGWWLMSIGGR